MEIPNTKKKNNTFYFRIVIPTDLRQFYENKTEIKFTLQTKDPLIAKKKVEPLTAKYKAEFESLRTTGNGVRDQAVRLLKSHGLEPEPALLNPKALAPEFEDSPFFRFAEKLNDSWLEPDCPPAEKLAMDILTGNNSITLSEARELALQGLTDRKRINDVNGAFNYVTALVVVDDVSRINPIALQRHVDTQQELSPNTVRRYINKVAVAVDDVYRQYGRQITNPLNNITYKKRKAEPQKRATLTPEQFTTLQQLIKSKWEVNSAKLVAILLNTGLRVAEVAGVETKHVVLDAPVPYLIITKTEQRRIKNTNSERRVPLFGISLEAVKALMSKNDKGRFIFPNYNKVDITRNDSASGATNKWLKKNGLTNITTHSFRHTLNTRMAEAGILEEIRKKCFGWKSQDMVAYYGNVQALTLLQNAINQLNEYEQSKESRYKTLPI